MWLHLLRGHFLVLAMRQWDFNGGSICCLICGGNGGRRRINFVDAKGKFELDGFEAFLTALDLLRW